MTKQEAAEQKAQKYQEIGMLFYELTKEAPIDEFESLFQELEAIDKQEEEDSDQNSAGSFCMNCGAELVPGTSFCMNCGTAITANTQPQASVSVKKKEDEAVHMGSVITDAPEKNTKKEKMIIYGLIGVIILFFVGICIAKMKGNGPSGVYECYTDYGEIVTGTYYKEIDAVDLAGESFRKER